VLEPVAVKEYVIETKKNIRKVPNEPAKKFDEGTIKEGLDGNKYIIKITLKGNKRWNKMIINE